MHFRQLFHFIDPNTWGLIIIDAFIPQLPDRCLAEFFRNIVNTAFSCVIPINKI